MYGCIERPEDIDNQITFRTGLIVFLITHVFHTIGFSINISFHLLDLWSAIFLLLLFFLFYRLFHPNLK
jgi:hypothetical protein